MAKKDKETTEEATGLDASLIAIKKKFGDGAVFRVTDDTIPGTEWISSGCESLDKALGHGFARGRIIEIYGPESAGKTTIALTAIKCAQKAGLTCAFIDAEHALDLGYAKGIGVEVDQLLVSQPDNGEQALEICDMLVRSNSVGLIVVDSVAALVPAAELEGDMGDSHMGLQARLMSQALRKLNGIAAQSNTTIMFTNQLRHKIGVMYGSPETVTGGQALKFYASQRLDIRKIDVLKEGDDKTGIRCRVKVVKNKVSPPFREAEFSVIFGEGIDWARDLVDLAVEKGLITKSGTWHSYGETKLGQGGAGAATSLRAMPEIAAEIRSKC